MGFNTKQPTVNYTVMVTKVSNGFVLHLLNDDGETVMTAIASEYGLRDYSSYNFVAAMEALWDYAEKLEKDKQPALMDTTMQQLLDEATTIVDFVAESKDSEL